MMRTVAIYSRVSTDSQTTENQERELREIATRMGWSIMKVYRDEGVSGAKPRSERPAFNALWKDATRRRFDMVMAWSVDRLGRSVASFHLIVIVAVSAILWFALNFFEAALLAVTPDRVPQGYGFLGFRVCRANRRAKASAKSGDEKLSANRVAAFNGDPLAREGELVSLRA